MVWIVLIMVIVLGVVCNVGLNLHAQAILDLEEKVATLENRIERLTSGS